MSGIFGLSSYNDQNLSGNIPDKTRESFREYGYFHAGGIDGMPYYSKIERIDFSNDTVTATFRNSYPLNLSNFGAVGNAFKSYTIGGRSANTVPPDNSFIFRFNYSNETITRVADLWTRSNFSVSTGNNSFGYTNPIYDENYIARSFISRLDYSNDLSTSSIRGPLSSARTQLTATGNSNFGYFGGGNSIVDRINYTNDTVTASIRGPLAVTIVARGATGNSNFGYFGGGSGPSSRVDRIDYANDTATASVRGPLSAARRRLSATGNSNFGYFNGGDTSPAISSVFSLIDRIDYSNDTVTASVRGSLNIPTNGGNATSSHSFGGSPNSQYGVFPKPFGYFGGGFPTTSRVDRIDYTNDTSIARTRGTLSLARFALAATGNSNFGYFGGGSSIPVPSFSIIDRIDYSNDLIILSTRGVLSLSRTEVSATGNSNFGYFGGGFTPGPTSFSTVDRIDYSNDSATSVVRGPLSSARAALAATGNSNFGYFGGGAPEDSTVNRIDYSNDSATSVVRGPLSLARFALAATGNSNFGYFGGGYTSGNIQRSTVDRIDYSNDTATASVRGPLSLAKNRSRGTGNSNFGYFGGGNPGPQYSTVDRIDYANDTGTASIRGPLSGIIESSSATSPLTPSSAFSPSQLPLGTSNTDFQPTSTFFDIQSMRRIQDTTNYSVKKRVLGSFGYFAGGTNTGRTNVSRIDYSNDTANASNRGSLIIASNSTFYNCVGNNNFSYMNTTFNTTDLQRIDYSNDTTNPKVFGGLSSLIGTYSRFTVYNDNFGYFGGGYRFPGTLNGTTRIERLNYSNDTGSPVARGNTDSVSINQYGLSNINYGWTTGGSLSNSTSTIRRINFSNDNVIAGNRGKLAVQVRECGGSNNNNFGYWVGGRNLSSPTGSAEVTLIQRLDFSNDTTNTSLRGNISSSPFSSGKISVTGTGNQNFGYYSGGGFGEGLSNIERITYSNDTVNASARGFLPYATNGAQASTNARNS